MTRFTHKKQSKRTKIFSTKRFEILSVLLLVVIAFAVRLYKIDNPIADWHAFRQADTASVTREYVKHGIDLLRPKYHDHSNIQSGLDNPDGYRMVEFPIINSLIAWVLRVFPTLALVQTSRLFAVFASLGTLVFLYLFTKKLSNKTTAWLTAFFFAVLPYSIYYSRVTLPEPFMLFFSMGSLWFLLKSLEEKTNFKKAWGWGLLSATLLATALLLKPFVAFLTPLYLTLIWQKQKIKSIKNPLWLAYAIVSITPLLLWRNWILNFPTGIPVSDWLFNGNGIRFRPAWFRWLFYERITKLILGFAGVILLPFTLLKPKKELAVHIAWWLGILAYFSVMATGNVQHDYYQVLIIPAICFALGSGGEALINNKKISKILSILLFTAISTIALFFSWQQTKGYFSVNHWEYVSAGKMVDQLLPEDAKVIAPAMGDTIFLFQTNRTGWPIGFEILDKIEKGATHYVSSSYDDEARDLEKIYKTIFKNEKFLILDLKKGGVRKGEKPL